METSCLERISDWVVAESTRVGSEHKLAEMLGLDHSTLIKWRRKQLKKGLSLNSVAAIAQYRGESQTQTENWLFGLNQSGSDSSETPTVAREIEIDTSVPLTGYAICKLAASLEEQVLALEVSMAKIKQDIAKLRQLADNESAKILSTESPSYNNNKGLPSGGNTVVDMNDIGRGAGAIGRLIRAEMSEKGLDPTQPESFQQFAMLLPLTEDNPNFERIRRIWCNEIPFADDDIIAAIAFALTDFSGRPYTANDLRHLNESVDNGHTNGCTTHH